MKHELVFILEPETGRATIEYSRTPLPLLSDIENDLGHRVNLNCGRPAGNQAENSSVCDGDELRSGGDPRSIWLYRIYHNSIADGPGRRSVVQLAGCSIRCPGCYIPETHERENGKSVFVSSIVQGILDHRDGHDGVTILGGEPFDQAGPLAELVAWLNREGIHLTVYSGHTLEALIRKNDPNVDYILTHIDMLIDGPFVKGESGGAGEYRGSRNQRVIRFPGK